MTHLSSTSVPLTFILSSLPNKAWGSYHSLNYFAIIVKCVIVHPTQVHIQITISRYSHIDYSYEFVGSALARFERSTLPDHEGTRTVVLRFLKIITPVKCVIPLYDGYVCCPKEGELYRKSRSTLKMDQSVWSIDIDKPKGAMIRGLRLLWDT